MATTTSEIAPSPTSLPTESSSIIDPPLASVSSTVASTLESSQVVENLNPSPQTDVSFTVTEKHVPLSLASPPPQHPEEKVSVDLPTAAAAEHQAERAPQALGSFKEESNKLSDLPPYEVKALDELRYCVRSTLSDNTLTDPTQSVLPQITSKAGVIGKSPITSSVAQDVSIWGIPLLKDDRTDVILLKFLRARDFDVREAYMMLKNTLIWRKEYNVDALIDEDLGEDLDKVVFMHGHDKEGHPVCYNLYGEFQNKELYNKTFGDVEKRERFLRWRVQFLEKSIRKLDFSPGGISTVFQVNDLKNSPGPGRRELRIASKRALQLVQDNYPEFVFKQSFINVPWWYMAFYTMMSPFMSARTKSKFVFAGPSKAAVTLFKYISPEQVPIQYGGLSMDFCDCNPEFVVDDPATEITIKPGTKQTVEIIVHEKCLIIWELRVVGWEVSYSAEYVPKTAGSYTIIIQKPKKMTPTDEPVVSGRFRAAELGKLLLTIDNPTTKKKQLLYRFKVELLDQ